MPKAADPLPTRSPSGDRLRRGPADYVLHFWRARGLMAATFAIALVLALLAAGAAPRGAMASAEITVSPASALLEERALLLETAEAAAERPGAFVLRLGSAPHTLLASYRAGNAEDAEAGLEMVLRAYRAIRAGPDGADPAAAAQERLAEAEQALADFRLRHGDQDPEAEAHALRINHEQQAEEAEALAVRRRDAELRLAAYRARLAVLAREAAPAVAAEDTTLAALRQQRAALLLRYREDSQAVQDLDLLITRQEGLALVSQDDPPGAVAATVDPARRLAEAEFAAARTELSAIIARERAVRENLARLSAERDERLTIAADYRQHLAAYQQAAGHASQGLSAPRRAALTFGPVAFAEHGLQAGYAWIAALFSALAAAFIAGLMRVFAETSLETPGSVTRSLGLPVLAAVPER